MGTYWGAWNPAERDEKLGKLVNHLPKFFMLEWFGGW